MGEPHLILTIETEQPVELNDFVGTFVGLSNQFERYVSKTRPDEAGTARFLVREVRAGSIITELVPYLAPAVPIVGGALAAIAHFNEVADFVTNMQEKISPYFSGGRTADASKNNLADFHRTVAATAHDPAGNLSLAAYQDGERSVVFAFGSAEARNAE